MPTLQKTNKFKKIVFAIAIVAAVFGIGIVGRNDLEIESVPQICRNYHGETICYQP